MTTEKQTSKANSKGDNGKAPAKPTDADREAAKKARSVAIRQNGAALYALLKDAGFTRDSYIELGESVKAGKKWDELHAVVMRILMVIGRDFKPEPVPDELTA